LNELLFCILHLLNTRTSWMKSAIFKSDVPKTTLYLSYEHLIVFEFAIW
jgi:hypothetical protein